MRWAVAVALVLVAGCTGGGGEDLLLLPTLPSDLSPVSPAVLVDTVGAVVAAELPDVRSAVVIEEVPGGDDSCGAEQQDRWAEAPIDSPVVAIPGVGYTRSRTAQADIDGVCASLTVVCDFDADGVLVVADEMQSTGTDQAVGNDYVQRVGSIAGRVDVGIPAEAVVAFQRFPEWTLLIPLDPDLHVLRLHALRGGDPERGYTIGEVLFVDADGRDVTAASVPIPDIIHGVPRDRGSAVPRDRGSAVEE
ncbi:hypothetical protein BH23ACT9_BH23ACT9_19590 [soil metagenome]